MQSCNSLHSFCGSKYIRYSRNHTGIGIEGDQHACLDALPVPLCGVGSYGFTANHLLELLCRFKEILLRLAPIAYVIRIVRAVEYTLSSHRSPDSSVRCFSLLRRLATFFLQTQDHTDGFHVGFHNYSLLNNLSSNCKIIAIILSMSS